MNSSHRIKVFGRELQVKSMASPARVREIEAFVNGKLADVAASVKGGDAQVMAILALMNIAEAYIALVQEHEELRVTSEKRLSGLLDRLNNAID